jgi:hypothetical protein
MAEQMSRFENRLNDVMSRISQSQQRATPPPTGTGQGDPISSTIRRPRI